MTCKAVNLKSYTGDFIWSAVEHGRTEEKFYEKEYYLKEDADKVIADLQKEVLQSRSAFNSLFSQTRAKRAQLRKEKRAAKHALKNLRVAFADAMRQIWSKEVELCHHEYVSSHQALTLEHFWDKVKDTLKRGK